MVSTKSGKSIKHTYAERVLGAYSQAQRGHRKQSVHLATLRSHVRNIAQDKKDKLGPKWASWVGKAVRRLEEQGIFQPDSNGYIRMTDEGKKALAAARRRVLGTSSRHTATLEEEERVWHTLNEQLSPASHFSTARRYSNAQSSRKRRQSMRSRPSVAAGGADSEYEHGSEEPSASTRTSPVIKRRRVASVDPFASATPSKPLSKMTKAELTKKVKELQSRLLASQAVTPMSEPQQAIAERQRLAKELHEAHRELDTYRRRTAIFGDQDEELTDIEDDGMRPESLMSPVGDTRITPPTPTPVRGRLNMLTLPRTESGSLIHGVSKQPTPAPSDDAHWEFDARQDMEYGVDDDGMGATAASLEDNRGDRRVTIEGGQVITPNMTPNRQEEREEEREASVLREKLSLLEHLVTEKGREIENLHADLASKDEALASLVEDNKINELQNTITSKDIELAQLHDSLASKDRRISELQTAVGTTSATIAEKDMMLAQKDGELSAERAKLTEQEDIVGALNERLEQKEGTINTLRSEHQRMRSEREELEAKMTSAQDELHTIHGTVDQVQTDYANAKEMVMDLEIELNNTRSRLQNIEERNSRTEDLLRAAQQQLLDMDSTIQAKDQSLVDNERAITDKDDTISELKRAVESVTVELNNAQASLADLNNRLLSVAAEQASAEAALRSTIEAVQSEKDSIAVSLSDLHVEKASLEAQGEELRRQVDSLTNSRRSARAECALAKETILKLLGTVDEAESAQDDERHQKETAKKALSLADAEVTRLRDRVCGVEMEFQGIRGELAKSQVELVAEQTTASMLRSEMTAVRGDLSLLQGELETVRKDLIDTRAALKRVEGEREEIRIAKQTDEDKIMDLTITYEKMKKLMNEMDTQFASVHSTPLAPQRERSRHTIAVATA